MSFNPVFTSAGGAFSVRLEGFCPAVHSVSRQAAAFITAVQISALSSVSTHACDLALVDVYAVGGESEHDTKRYGEG